MKLGILFCVLVLVSGKAFGETVYDQPYLGELPPHLRGRFSASVWEKSAGKELKSIVERSDIIVLAESMTLGERVDSTTGFTTYHSDVRALRFYKGTLNNRPIRLKFRAFTTGIEKGARHLFFLKESVDGYEVLKSSYVFPKGQGYDNYMRLFGAIDCSEDLGVDLVAYLVSRNRAKQFDARLLGEYRNISTYCAVHIASATSPVFGDPVLQAAVAVHDRRLFDIDIYGTAAYALAIQKKSDYWVLILENIPVSASYGRIAESIAFDLAANLGDADTVSVIKAVVEKKPELAVSASFALAKMGGSEAQATIAMWIRDPELSKRKEKISSGWLQRTEHFSVLFEQALVRLKNRN